MRSVSTVEVYLSLTFGGVEKEKLEVYLDGFESLRHRQRRLKGLEAQVRRHAPKVSDKYTSTVETDRIDTSFRKAPR